MQGTQLKSWSKQLLDIKDRTAQTAVEYKTRTGIEGQKEWEALIVHLRSFYARTLTSSSYANRIWDKLEGNQDYKKAGGQVWALEATMLHSKRKSALPLLCGAAGGCGQMLSASWHCALRLSASRQIQISPLYISWSQAFYDSNRNQMKIGE